MTRRVLVAFMTASLAILSPALSAQSPGAWRVLFDGKDLDSFTQTGAAQWKIDNGAIVGGSGATGQRGSSLVSKDQFKDLELELDFMLAEHEAYNSGVYLRTGYQVNFGRHEAGEFIGVVVHRVTPESIRGNVLWLDKGDQKFPSLRKKEDWNHVRIAFKGPRLQVWLNGTQICDVTDTPTDPAEAKWKEAGPISFQWPPAGEGGGFAGYVKLRNIRVRDLS
jgi:3-keto-disaccharide hydrolase